MKVSRQILNERDIENLGALVGQTWINISGDGMVEANMSFDPVRIETSESTIEIALDLEEIQIVDEPDEYPIFRVRPAHEISEMAISSGYIYFQGRDELISEVWILRESLTNFQNDEIHFENTADIAISFKLTNIWISTVRATHFSDVLDIHYSSSKEEISLPDTLDEWEADLIDQYELSREWIRIA